MRATPALPPVARYLPPAGINIGERADDDLPFTRTPPTHRRATGRPGKPPRWPEGRAPRSRCRLIALVQADDTEVRTAVEADDEHLAVRRRRKRRDQTLPGRDPLDRYSVIRALPERGRNPGAARKNNTCSPSAVQTGYPSTDGSNVSLVNCRRAIPAARCPALDPQPTRRRVCRPANRGVLSARRGASSTCSRPSGQSARATVPRSCPRRPTGRRTCHPATAVMRGARRLHSDLFRDDDRIALRLEPLGIEPHRPQHAAGHVQQVAAGDVLGLASASNQCRLLARRRDRAPRFANSPTGDAAMVNSTARPPGSSNGKNDPARRATCGALFRTLGSPSRRPRR